MPLPTSELDSPYLVYRNLTLPYLLVNFTLPRTQESDPALPTTELESGFTLPRILESLVSEKGKGVLQTREQEQVEKISQSQQSKVPVI